MTEMGFRRFWGRNGYPVYVPSTKRASTMPGGSWGLNGDQLQFWAGGGWADYNYGGFAFANNYLDIVLPATGHIDIFDHISTGGVIWGGPAPPGGWYFSLRHNGTEIGTYYTPYAYGGCDIDVNNLFVNRGDVISHHVTFIYMAFATIPNYAGGRGPWNQIALTYVDELEVETGVSRSLEVHLQPTPHVTEDTYPDPRTADIRMELTSGSVIAGPLSATFHPGSTSGDGYGLSWDSGNVFTFTTDLYEFLPTRVFMYATNTSSLSTAYTDGQSTFAWPSNGYGSIPTGLTITSVPVPVDSRGPGGLLLIGMADLTYNPDGLDPDAGGTGMVTEGWGQEVLPVTGGTFTTTGPVSRGTLTVFDGEGRQMTQGTEWEYADNTGRNFTVMEGWPAYVTAAYRVTEPVLRPHFATKRITNPSVYADRIRLYDIKGV